MRKRIAALALFVAMAGGLTVFADTPTPAPAPNPVPLPVHMCPCVGQYTTCVCAPCRCNHAD